MTNNIENNFIDIHSNEDIKSLIDETNCINGNVRIKESKTKNIFSSVEHLVKINGNLFIQFIQLKKLGSIKHITGNLYISESPEFISLENLEKIERDAVLRYSSLISIGRLKHVGGKLSLRDTPIQEISELTFVGNDLFLPIRFKDKIENKLTIKGKIRFWNNKNISKISAINKNNNWGNNSNTFFSEIHGNELLRKKRLLTGEFLVKKIYQPSGLNEYIIENITEYFLFIDLKLEKLYGNNYSFFETLFNEISTSKKLNSEFPKVKIDKRKSINYNDLKKQVNEVIKLNQNKFPFKKYRIVLENFKKKYLFSGYTSKYYLDYKSHKLDFTEFTGVSKNSFIYFLENIILEIFSVYLNNSQNEFRVSKGMPRIGEGWISETELYHKLKTYFNEEKVIQHGKPKWLGRQHVDVWFPKYKIGIEFQGKQHYEPISFFGGKEAFEKNKLRDKKKKKLFKENNAILIEVTHGYDFEKLKSAIENKNFQQ